MIIPPFPFKEAPPYLYPAFHVMLLSRYDSLFRIRQASGYLSL
jgi:hypothetical protein